MDDEQEGPPGFCSHCGTGMDAWDCTNTICTACIIEAGDVHWCPLCGEPESVCGCQEIDGH